MIRGSAIKNGFQNDLLWATLSWDWNLSLKVWCLDLLSAFSFSSSISSSVSWLSLWSIFQTLKSPKIILRLKWWRMRKEQIADIGSSLSSLKVSKYFLPEPSQCLQSIIKSLFLCQPEWSLRNNAEAEDSQDDWKSEEPGHLSPGEDHWYRVGQHQSKTETNVENIVQSAPQIFTGCFSNVNWNIFGVKGNCQQSNLQICLLD